MEFCRHFDSRCLRTARIVNFEDKKPFIEVGCDFMHGFEMPFKVQVQHIKEFDWENAKEHKHRMEFNFLRKVYNKKISEEDFLIGWEKLRPYINKNHRSPSYGRAQYRKLRDIFGFFNPQNK